LKVNLIFIIFLGLWVAPLTAQQYDQFFTTQSCRVDVHFSGNTREMNVYLEKIKQEPYWGGRVSDLTPMNVPGDFRFTVTDSATNQLIYTDGFNTLFREWQTTPEAEKVNKSFENTVVFPFPKTTVRLCIERRTGFNSWELLLAVMIRPDDALIQRTGKLKVPVKVLRKPSQPSEAVDIAIIGEGYTAGELKKFYREADRLVGYIVSHEPFKTYKSRLNFYAVGALSNETGVSKPHEGKWKNSALGAHYHTFYSPRYLTSPRHFLIRDYASAVPYDAIYILVNTDEYGGGGIYNFYALTSARGRDARAVTVHEFGHSFAGLADEYFYEGGDALDGMYPLHEEPWEPNITTLKHFEHKWLADLPEGTPVPTPLPEDSAAANPAAVPASQSTSLLGVYEGGGYKTKGIYRPTPDCRMKTNKAAEFCPVCIKAVEARIRLLTGAL